MVVYRGARLPMPKLRVMLKGLFRASPPLTSPETIELSRFPLALQQFVDGPPAIFVMPPSGGLSAASEQG